MREWNSLIKICLFGNALVLNDMKILVNQLENLSIVSRLDKIMIVSLTRKEWVNNSFNDFWVQRKSFTSFPLLHWRLYRSRKDKIQRWKHVVSEDKLAEEMSQCILSGTVTILLAHRLKKKEFRINNANKKIPCQKLQRIVTSRTSHNSHREINRSMFELLIACLTN